MSHLDEWQMFSRRYGLMKQADEPDWARRHAPLWTLTADDRRAPEPARRCRCPGSQFPGPTLCNLAATQEDILCDECRQWCVALDEAGQYHLIADLPSARG